ncbi:hypothetical protein K0M31_011589 [Melipona bicolor]|uniref:Uncharacterized protein n=1 Tax=Melipona bicolor TaxID=60889 RepID=A0AA40GA24_9HYME|nr:hypothetical protein K0M31_011589 [Melipona bicolor]
MPIWLPSNTLYRKGIVPLADLTISVRYSEGARRTKRSENIKKSMYERKMKRSSTKAKAKNQGPWNDSVPMGS